MIISNQGQVNKKVLYAQAVFDEREKQAVIETLENGWLASGREVENFELHCKILFNKDFSLAVNSGSSANLVGLSALELPKGTPVITPATTFATTVSSAIQAGYKPIFVDSVIGRYTINEDLVEAAIDTHSKNSQGIIMVPQLIGGVCDMEKLRRIADKYNWYLFDDSCDTFAPRLRGRTVASYADISTTSFYGSHIITAMGMGGMLFTDKQWIIDNAKIIRDWGRVGNDSEDFNTRFDFEIDGIPYDSKFLYSKLGYNLKMTEAAAAFGLVQLEKLPDFTERRQKNFNTLREYFTKYEKWFYLPYLVEGASTNWLAFPLTVRKKAPFKRYDLLKHLEAKGIQTRVLFSGNITRHPLYSKVGIDYKISGSLDNADEIMASGFLLGCHQGIDDNKLQYMIDSLEEYFDKI